MKNSTLILSILLCFLISFQDVRAQEEAQTELEDLIIKERTEKQNIEIVNRVYKELNAPKITH